MPGSDGFAWSGGNGDWDQEKNKDDNGKSLFDGVRGLGSFDSRGAHADSPFQTRAAEAFPLRPRPAVGAIRGARDRRIDGWPWRARLSSRSGFPRLFRPGRSEIRSGRHYSIETGPVVAHPRRPRNTPMLLTRLIVMSASRCGRRGAPSHATRFYDQGGIPGTRTKGIRGTRNRFNT